MMLRLVSFGVGAIITFSAALLATVIAYAVTFSFDRFIGHVNLDDASGILYSTFLGTASATVAALASGRKGVAAMILRIVISLALAILAAVLAAATLVRFASGLSDGLSFCVLVVTVIGVAGVSSVALARRSERKAVQ